MVTPALAQAIEAGDERQQHPAQQVKHDGEQRQRDGGGQFADVRSCDEGLFPRAGEHHHAHPVIEFQRGESLFQLLEDFGLTLDFISG